MPSGAKKRKAAKKKKEKEANNTSSVTHGDDDLKHHDEKQSDGGEVSSPASQDHHNHQHPFTEGEEEEVEKREIKVEGVVQIDREAKSAHESENKDIRIEYSEAAHEKHTSSSSSSSSSDDESHVEKAVVVETAPFVDAVSKVVTHSVLVGNTCNSVVDNAPVVATERVSLLEEVAHINESAFVTSAVVEPGLEENGEKKLPQLEENVGVSIVAIDLESQEKDNEVVSTSDGIAVASLDARDLAAQENDDKMLVSYNAPGADTSNSAEHLKDPKVPECLDIQPLGDSAPRPVQTTSWKSCCGLFELLTGSNS